MWFWARFTRAGGSTKLPLGLVASGRGSSAAMPAPPQTPKFSACSTKRVGPRRLASAQRRRRSASTGLAPQKSWRGQAGVVQVAERGRLRFVRWTEQRWQQQRRQRSEPSSLPPCLTTPTSWTPGLSRAARCSTALQSGLRGGASGAAACAAGSSLAQARLAVVARLPAERRLHQMRCAWHGSAPAILGAHNAVRRGHAGNEVRPRPRLVNVSRQLQQGVLHLAGARAAAACSRGPSGGWVEDSWKRNGWKAASAWHCATLGRQRATCHKSRIRPSCQPHRRCSACRCPARRRRPPRPAPPAALPAPTAAARSARAAPSGSRRAGAGRPAGRPGA